MKQRCGRKLTKFVTYPDKNKLYLPHCYSDKGYRRESYILFLKCKLVIRNFVESPLILINMPIINIIIYLGQLNFLIIRKT